MISNGFDFRIGKICKYANRKVRTLARVTPYMVQSKNDLK